MELAQPGAGVPERVIEDVAAARSETPRAREAIAERRIRDLLDDERAARREVIERPHGAEARVSEPREVIMGSAQAEVLEPMALPVILAYDEPRASREILAGLGRRWQRCLLDDEGKPGGAARELDAEEIRANAPAFFLDADVDVTVSHRALHVPAGVGANVSDGMLQAAVLGH
jgi:hypothetical protein